MTGAADKRGKDELAAYVLLATSCDKSLATTAAFTSIRVVCQNTLFFAMEDIKTERRPQVKVPHNLRFDADRVKEGLGLMDKAWSGFIDKVRKMADYPMNPDEPHPSSRSCCSKRMARRFQTKPNASTNRSCALQFRSWTRLKQREGNPLGSRERHHLLRRPCTPGCWRRQAG